MEVIHRHKKKVEPEVNERGHKIITPPYLKRLCEELDLYETPHLNDKLFLHFKGFQVIENLEAYYNLKVIYLDHNLFKRIEGLNSLVYLKALYLQNNLIERLEGLDRLTELVTLNLAHNQITKIENIQALTQLNALDLSYNELASSVNLMGLKECPSLTNVDLSHNYIIYDEDLIPIFSALPNIACLYMGRNPLCDSIAGYRKRMVAALSGAKFLDDRPITELEKRLAIAWLRGGRDAEAEERKSYFEEKELKNEKTGEEKEKDEKARMRLQLEAERYDREAIDKREKLLQKREKLLDEQPEDMLTRLKEIEIELVRTEEYLQERGKRMYAKLERVDQRINNFKCMSRTLNDKGEYVYMNNLSHDEVQQYQQKRSEEWNKSVGIQGNQEYQGQPDEIAAKDEDQAALKNANSNHQHDKIEEDADETPDHEKLKKSSTTVEWTDELKGKLEEIVDELNFDFDDVTEVFNTYLQQGVDYKSQPVTVDEIRRVYTAIEIEKYRN